MNTLCESYRIIRHTSEEMNVPISEIVSKCRKTDIVQCRQLVSALLRERKWPFTKIADVFKKNHATIIYNIEMHKIDCKYNEIYRLHFFAIKEMLQTTALFLLITIKINSIPCL